MLFVVSNQSEAVPSSNGSPDNGTVIAIAAFHAREIDAYRQHDEVRGSDLDPRLVLGRRRKARATGFQSFTLDHRRVQARPTSRTLKPEKFPARKCTTACI
jgi:hypothetical protein